MGSSGSTMRGLVLLLTGLILVHNARIPRQTNLDSPNQSCCRCQDSTAFCNNDLARQEGDTRSQLTEGLTCQKNINCLVFSICNEDNVNCLDEDKDIQSIGKSMTVRRAENEEDSCRAGQTLCCNPVPGSILQPKLQLRAGLVNFDDPLGDGEDDPNSQVEGEGIGGRGQTLQICDSPDLKAVVNFDIGLTCGKRDSRVYREVRKSEQEGGVGEVTNQESGPGLYSYSTEPNIWALELSWIMTWLPPVQSRSEILSTILKL